MQEKYKFENKLFQKIKIVKNEKVIFMFLLICLLSMFSFVVLTKYIKYEKSIINDDVYTFYEYYKSYDYSLKDKQTIFINIVESNSVNILRSILPELKLYKFYSTKWMKTCILNNSYECLELIIEYHKSIQNNLPERYSKIIVENFNPIVEAEYYKREKIKKYLEENEDLLEIRWE